MPELLHLERLKERKHLLAFSGGADSTALFHLLLEHNIDFDIVHVNYGTRPQSDREASDAQAKAKLYGKRCYLHSCSIGNANFEHRAREERYRFFAHLIEKYGYASLLTAHQLNDRLEWLLMQLCRGSGLPELLGIRSCDRREGMEIIRPLLEWNREQIERYLEDREIRFHNDASNADERYTRNRFRHRYATPLMREYGSQIRRSFAYLEEDADALIEPVAFERICELHYAPASSNRRSDIAGIDRLLKSLGYVLKSSEKERLKENGTIVAGRRFVVAIGEGYLLIGPYLEAGTMDKKFKEECRRLGIAPKLRGYLHTEPSAWDVIRRLKGAQVPLRSGSPR